MLFFIRFIFVAIWFFFCSFVGLVISLVRFKNPNSTRFAGQIWSRGAMFILGVHLEVEGRENLYKQTPCVYIGNHQNLFDLILFSNLYPRNTIIIAKQELLYIPFFGLFFWAAGHALIKRQDRTKSVSALNIVVDKIKKENCSVFLFPEGTRNRSENAMLPFKKGAFHMAIQAQIPIVPIIAQEYRNTINAKEFRFDLKSVKVKILPPIFPPTKDPAQVTVWMQDVQKYFEQVMKSL